MYYELPGEIPLSSHQVPLPKSNLHFLYRTMIFFLLLFKDEMRDKAGSKAVSAHYEECVIQCADTNIRALSGVTKRLQTQLSKIVH